METREALFGLGCFWEPDISFSELPGVVETIVGYAGEAGEHPTYEQVCGGSGHTEVVKVVYNPAEITYQELLEHFFAEHDPTRTAKAQYKSVIFYLNDEQRATARAAIGHEEERRGAKLATELTPAPAFYRAEEYHQKYLAKR